MSMWAAGATAVTFFQLLQGSAFVYLTLIKFTFIPIIPVRVSHVRLYRGGKLHVYVTGPGQDQGVKKLVAAFDRSKHLHHLSLKPAAGAGGV